MVSVSERANLTFSAWFCDCADRSSILGLDLFLIFHFRAPAERAGVFRRAACLSSHLLVVFPSYHTLKIVIPDLKCDSRLGCLRQISFRMGRKRPALRARSRISDNCTGAVAGSKIAVNPSLASGTAGMFFPAFRTGPNSIASPFSPWNFLYLMK